MNKRLLFACLALADLAPHQAWAQFTDPHTYDNTPVGINQLELNYAYVHSDTSIDASLVITGAKLNLNQGTVSYTRYFGALHRLMWAQASLPIGGLSGSIAGASVHGSITGSGDSGYQAAMLLKGGPALTIPQFENYKPQTIVGVSLTITAPTRLHNPVKILNLGSECWFFKPNSHSRIHSGLIRSGSSTHISTATSTSTTPHSTNRGLAATTATRSRRTHQLFSPRQHLGIS